MYCWFKTEFNVANQMTKYKLSFKINKQTPFQIDTKKKDPHFHRLSLQPLKCLYHPGYGSFSVNSFTRVSWISY